MVCYVVVRFAFLASELSNWLIGIKLTNQSKVAVVFLRKAPIRSKPKRILTYVSGGVCFPALFALASGWQRVLDMVLFLVLSIPWRYILLL